MVEAMSDTLPAGAGRGRGEGLQRMGREMNADTYTFKQAARDAQYRRDYDTWLKSLSRAQLARLKAAGLDEPLMPGNGNGMSDQDLADSPLASETPDIAGEVDAYLALENTGKPVETHEMAKEGGVKDEPCKTDPDAIWEIVRRLIGELMVQRNAKLALECLALVSGVSFIGDSMSDIARRHGVTRAAVSKRCVEMSEKLNMLPSRAMRSLTARKAYARARNRHIDDRE